MRAVITWEQLLIFLAVFLIFYYGGICLMFYRKELAGLAVKKPRSMQPFLAADLEKPTGEKPVQEASLYNQVLELMEDCKPVFQAAVNQQLDKEQVMAALRLRVQKYSSIRGTAFQVAVTNHLAQELDQRLGMVLTDADADMLWR